MMGVLMAKRGHRRRSDIEALHWEMTLAGVSTAEACRILSDLPQDVLSVVCRRREWRRPPAAVAICRYWSGNASRMTATWPTAGRGNALAVPAVAGYCSTLNCARWYGPALEVGTASRRPSASLR
jgi:hypothetical protein